MGVDSPTSFFGTSTVVKSFERPWRSSGRFLERPQSSDRMDDHEGALGCPSCICFVCYHRLGLAQPECLTTHDMNFASRPRFSGTEHLGYECMLLGLDPYDRRCRNLRRFYTLQLLSPSRVELSQYIRREMVSKLVRGLFQMTIKTKASDVVDMRSMMVDLIIDIILRSMLLDGSYMEVHSTSIRSKLGLDICESIVRINVDN